MCCLYTLGIVLNEIFLPWILCKSSVNNTLNSCEQMIAYAYFFIAHFLAMIGKLVYFLPSFDYTDIHTIRYHYDQKCYIETISMLTLNDKPKIETKYQTSRTTNIG